jgi:two pore calcium channel protein
VQLVSWIVLAVYTLYPITFSGNKLFWKSRLDNVKVILLVLLAADTIFNAIYVAPWGPIDNIPFRLAPYIRVIIVAISIRGLRDCMRTLMGIIPDFLNIAALLLLFLLFSSWLAYVLFEDTAQGKTVFTSYGATLYQMSILFTTANNPDVWMPAYQVSRYTCVFFILYILFGVYFITNLVLAVVYDSFKGQVCFLSFFGKKPNI